MNLSEIPRLLPFTLIRDNEFLSLGPINQSSPKILVFLDDEAYLPPLSSNANISCVITTEKLACFIEKRLGLAILDTPRALFYRLHNHLAQNTDFYWQNFANDIAGDAVISFAATIANRNVRIGQRCIIEPGAIIMEHSLIANDVIIRAGCVIGSQGFEFKRLENHIFPVAHSGGVWIHHRAEIQANTVIDRAVFGGFTEIGEETKIDNLVHIAHNVRIGKRCLIVALSMLGGSVTIGDDVFVGPSAVIRPEVRIGPGAVVSMGSVVTKDVEPGQKVTGNFALDHQKFIEFIKSIR
jgi:UDP-3-O-[3-hydroxymyristoyl] glucosamine N-acyltransferase